MNKLLINLFFLCLAFSTQAQVDSSAAAPDTIVVHTSDSAIHENEGTPILENEGTPILENTPAENPSAVTPLPPDSTIRSASQDSVPCPPSDSVCANRPDFVTDSIARRSDGDVIITDSVYEQDCLPDIVTFENATGRENSIVNAPEAEESFMNSDDVNPYKFTATTVPKGAIICLRDTNMPVFLVPCTCAINSGFGYRRWGRYYQFHPGIDLNLPYGQPACAAFDGIVRFAKMTPGYGNCVIIRHPNGLETLYGHFSELAVTPGQTVKAGDVVGYCGNTGYSFGAHLHFELRYMGVPFDPAKVISMQTFKLIQESIIIDNSLFQGNTPPPPSKYKYLYHVVKKGETLSSIARKYHVSVAYICKLNRITTKTILRPGRTLRIR